MALRQSVLETDLIRGEHFNQNTGYAILAGALIVVNALALRWWMELLVNSTWSTSGLVGDEDQTVSPARIYLKRVFDEPIYMFARTPLVHTRVLIDMVGDGALLARGVREGELEEPRVGWFGRMKERYVVNGYRIRGYHVALGVVIVILLVGTELATAVVYLSGKRTPMRDRNSLYGLEMVVPKLDGDEGISAGALSYQDIIGASMGKESIKIKANLYRIPGPGFSDRGEFSREQRWNLTSGVYLKSGSKGKKGEGIYIVTRHSNKTAVHEMVLTTRSANGKLDVKVPVSFLVNSTFMEINFRVCANPGEFPTRGRVRISLSYRSGRGSIRRNNPSLNL